MDGNRLNLPVVCGYTEMYRAVHSLLYGLINEKNRSVVETRFADYFAETISDAQNVSVIHGDLGSANILCDKETGDITGVLDWAELSVGDRAVDYAALTCRAGIPGCRDDLLSLQPSWQHCLRGQISFSLPSLYRKRCMGLKPMTKLRCAAVWV